MAEINAPNHEQAVILLVDDNAINLQLLYDTGNRWLRNLLPPEIRSGNLQFGGHIFNCLAKLRGKSTGTVNGCH